MFSRAKPLNALVLLFYNSVISLIPYDEFCLSMQGELSAGFLLSFPWEDGEKFPKLVLSHQD